MMILEMRLVQECTMMLFHSHIANRTQEPGMIKKNRNCGSALSGNGFQLLYPDGLENGMERDFLLFEDKNMYKACRTGTVAIKNLFDTCSFNRVCDIKTKELENAEIWRYITSKKKLSTDGETIHGVINKEEWQWKYTCNFYWKLCLCSVAINMGVTIPAKMISICARHIVHDLPDQNLKRSKTVLLDLKLFGNRAHFLFHQDQKRSC